MTGPSRLANKAKSTLGSIRQSTASRPRQVNLPLFAALIRPHLINCVQFHSTGETLSYWRMQQRVKAPQHLSFKEGLGLFNLAKSRGRPHQCGQIFGGKLQRKQSQALFNGAQGQHRRQWAQTKILNMPSEHQKTLFFKL